MFTCFFILCIISPLEAANTDALLDYVGRIVEYKADQLRDPFGTQDIEKEVAKEEVLPEEEYSDEPLPELEVQGVVWGNIPQAIINGQVVGLGDTVSGVRVQDIDKNCVTVIYGNKQHRLSPSGSAKEREDAEDKDLDFLTDYYR